MLIVVNPRKSSGDVGYVLAFETVRDIRQSAMGLWPLRTKESKFTTLPSRNDRYTLRLPNRYQDRVILQAYR